jgi:hypothetical protein
MELKEFVQERSKSELSTDERTTLAEFVLQLRSSLLDSMAIDQKPWLFITASFTSAGMRPH